MLSPMVVTPLDEQPSLVSAELPLKVSAWAMITRQLALLRPLKSTAPWGKYSTPKKFMLSPPSSVVQLTEQLLLPPWKLSTGARRS